MNVALHNTSPHSAYDGLNYVDHVTPYDPKADRPLFDAIAEALHQHDALNVFGICLLHSHFEVAAEEVVWETFDAQRNSLDVKVVNGGPDMAELPAISWRFTNGQFCALTHGSLGLEPAELEQHKPLLADVAEILVRFDVEQRFGISVFNRGIVAHLGRSHIEYTDEKSRIQALTPQWRGPKFTQKKFLQTSWNFSRAPLWKRPFGVWSTPVCPTECLVGDVHGPWHTG